MTRSTRRQLRTLARTWSVCLVLGLNIMGIVVMTGQIGGQDNIATYACHTNTVLMTNVTPDIHC